MRIAFVALAAAFTELAACSGSSNDGVLGGSTSRTEPTGYECTRAGRWRESFTKIEGDDEVCEPIRPSEFRPTGNVNADERKCDFGCKCENGLDLLSCNGTVKEACAEDDATKSFDCSFSKVNDKKLEGTCVFDYASKGSGAKVHCKYAIAYDWLEP